MKKKVLSKIKVVLLVDGCYSYLTTLIAFIMHNPRLNFKSFCWVVSEIFEKHTNRQKRIFIKKKLVFLELETLTYAIKKIFPVGSKK